MTQGLIEEFIEWLEQQPDLELAGLFRWGPDGPPYDDAGAT
jgi:hypothetical protein